MASASTFPHNIDRYPGSVWQRLYKNRLYCFEVTDNGASGYNTHGGIPDWYYAETIAGNLQNGFWHSPWGGGANDPLPLKTVKTGESYDGENLFVKKSISSFQTFGSVSVDDGVYTITEGEGNAGIYKTVTFPLNAEAVIFEYKFTQEGDGDFIGVSVGTNEAVFVGEDNPLSRELFVFGEGDLSSVAGTTTMLTFKLISRGDPNAQVQIKAIEILTDPDPDPALGPSVRANGERGTVTVPHGQSITITVTMAAGEYIGIYADWWVVAIPSYGNIWYYLNSVMEWVDFPAGDLMSMQPAMQGPLMNVPDPVTVLPSMALPRGTYIFHFAVDQMDGILNYPDGPILVDSVTVVVE